MKDNIPLAIGKLSSGEEYVVNLAELPNLFITYSNDTQLPVIFISFIQKLLKNEQAIQLALSVSSRLAEKLKPLVPAESVFIDFLHNDFEEGKVNSIDEFITVLKKEMKHRKVLIKSAPHGLNTMPALLVLIDDIFEVLKSKHKKTTLAFIELLMNADSFKIYFILGSSGIYRSLLEQVINVNPVLQKKLKRSGQQTQISQPLGAELVINPDGLFFFRGKGQQIHTRLYPALII